MTDIIEVTHRDNNALPYLIEQAKNEGWNPGVDDVNTFLTADPHGFFLGRLDDKIIGCASAVRYDENFAFFGFYIVEEPYRGKGYGLQITEARLRYAGDRCVGLDGVLENEKMYQKIGFERAFVSRRHALSSKIVSSHEANEKILKIQSDAQLRDICDYDRFCFPAARIAFLHAWIKSPHAIAFSYEQDNEIEGYVVMRKCFSGFKIGPLFADSTSIASNLLQAALHHANGETVYIDVPESNKSALAMIDPFITKSDFACARMYRNGSPQIEMDRIFAITTFELG